MDIIEAIKKLNNPRFGSFGEFIFESQNSTQKIERKHSENVDFILNGKNIDVKSTRCFNKKGIPPKKYNGQKLNNIEYAYIQFYSDTVICSIGEVVVFKLSYSQIETFYKTWLSDRKQSLPIAKKISKEYQKNLKILKDSILNLYSELGLKARIIYRTNQNKFGKESPGNLIPKIQRENSVTVFLSFKDYRISENNLDQIIAFNDTEAYKFPLIKNPKLHEPKVDLELLDNKYKFKTLNSLFKSTGISSAST